MGFDYEKYSNVMDECLEKLKVIKVLDDKKYSETIKPVCDFLRIAKLEMFYYKTLEDEQKNVSEDHLIYGTGNYDEKRCVDIREITDGGNAVRYYAYQYKDDEDWNDIYLSKIEFFLKMFYSFNGRTKLNIMCTELTYYDNIMGIPNLSYYLKFVAEKLAKGEIGRYGASFFNIKAFSSVNERFGRKNGDIILKKYATDLQDMLSKDEIVCRVGGDNFVVLFFKDNLDKVKDYFAGARVGFNDEGATAFVCASAGIYMVPENCRSVNTVMDAISKACGVAKNVLKETCVFFDDELVARMNHNKKIESVFQGALNREEFQVYYQPKVNIKTSMLAGAEALCRWDKDDEILPPISFIPILEQSKRICELDFYMLEHVCRDLREWIDSGMDVVQVSVNMSRKHLSDEDFLENILNIIDSYGVPHEYIEIELTETTTEVDYDNLKKIVLGLARENICTSVDDFGIGYSSLNLIRELPWDVLKIDKSFLNTKNSRSNDNIMLKHIIALGHDLGLQCIVEGVETEEHIKILLENNCCMAQGYYFDKPLPKQEYVKRLMNFSYDK